MVRCHIRVRAASGRAGRSGLGLALTVLVSTVPLWAVTPLPARAQRTGGAIRGRVVDASDQEPANEVLVTATSPAAQGEEFAVTNAGGRFTFNLLPPGVYRLIFEGDGFRPRTVEDVEVRLGQTTPVSLGLVPTTVEAEEIVIETSAPVVDRGSTEIGETVDLKFVRAAPSPRNYTETMERLTPGASADQTGVTVFGATGAENSYVIDGLNTTSVGSGQSGSTLPLDFFEAIEVKTGGYMPEFGRSTGGIFNLSLRRGGNEFHGDVFAYLRPGFLRANPVPVSRYGEAIARQDLSTMDMDVGVALGGPILKDKLWFFAGFNPRFQWSDVQRIRQQTFDNVTQDAQGRITSMTRDGFADTRNGELIQQEVGRDVFPREIQTYNAAGRLTLKLDQENTLSLSYFGNPGSRNGVGPTGRTNNGLSGEPSAFLGYVETGSHNLVLNHEGHYFDRSLQLEAFAGFHTARFNDTNRVDRPGISAAYLDTLNAREPGACPVAPTDRAPDNYSFNNCAIRDYRLGGSGYFESEVADRYVAGARLTHLLEGHQIRYGVDFEFKRFASTRGYSGGYFTQHFGPNPNQNDEWLRRWFSRDNQSMADPYFFGVDGPPFSAEARGLTFSAFLQDSWEVNEYVTLNGGVRWDYEIILDSDGNPAIEIPDEIAPRLGISVDPTGVGRTRFFASYGWFYESIPLTIGQRAFTREGTALRYVNEDGSLRGTEYRTLGGNNTPVANDLRGQYHQEIMVGGEVEIDRGWVAGVNGVYRNLERVIEDISPNDGSDYFIANPGFNDCNIPAEFRGPLAESCSLARPGGSPIYDPSRTVFPKPERRYYGLIFTVRKDFSDHWQARASYALSRSEGNYTGLFAADNGQLDPNLTSQFDIPSLLPNRLGPLPNDQTHNIKVSGSYELGGITGALRGLTLGLTYNGKSGTPISYLARHEDYGRREAFILPRGSAGRTPFVHRFDAMVGYDIPIAQGMHLNFNATVFNMFNFQEAIQVDQEYTTKIVTPQSAGTPLESVVAQDEVNPSFRRPQIRQQPLYVQLGARLSF